MYSDHIKKISTDPSNSKSLTGMKLQARETTIENKVAFLGTLI